MGLGYREKSDLENQSEDERVEEIKRLNPDDMELKTVTTGNYDTGLPQVIPGVVKPMFKTHHLKYAIFAFNGILAVLGFAILVLAIWVRADPEFWEYKRNINIESFYAVCHMLIVAGLIIFFVAFVGCIGAYSEHQLLLTSYFIVLTLIFILQLAAVIMVWSAPYSKDIKKGLEFEIKRQIKNRDKDDTSRFVIDLMQQNLQCCGALSQSDFETAVPNSCQSERTGIVYASDCTSKLLEYLRSKAGVIAGVIIPILLFQFFALLAVIALLHNIKNESKYNM